MIRLAGVGLHGGAPCAVTLARVDAATPTFVEAGGARATLRELSVVRADQGVCVALSSPSLASDERGPTVELMEHLLAAVGAAGAFHGLSVSVEGGEIPLLDGGARAFCEALRTLELVAASPAPAARVAREFVTTLGESIYRFTPGAVVEARVDIDFAHPALGASSAWWAGNFADFAARIAPARTFGFMADHAALLARGRARSVDPDAVVIFDEEGTLNGPLAGEDEPARHKLLDLIGDLTLLGGPPRGLVHAHKPGHARTHQALRRALEAGALVVSEASL